MSSSFLLAAITEATTVESLVNTKNVSTGIRKNHSLESKHVPLHLSPIFKKCCEQIRFFPEPTTTIGLGEKI